MSEWPKSLPLKGRTICVVTPVPLEADSRTLKQVCTLRREGADVMAVAARERVTVLPVEPFAFQKPNPAARRDSPLSRIWTWVRTTRLPAPLVAPFFAAWLGTFLWQTARAAAKLPNASLYVLHGVTSYPTYVLSGRKGPFVYDIHDFYCGVEPEAELGTFERVFHRPFIRFLERKCLAKASSAVTVSDGLADLVEESYGRRPTVIRNGHDSRLDAETPGDIRAVLDLHSDTFVIVVIGNRKQGQRFDALFSALGNIPETVHLVLIGRGYETLTAEIERAGLTKRVHVVGALPAWSIVSFTRSANLAALPYYERSDNYRSSLPNGFFQSIGAGLPLLYPDLPEMRALAERYALGSPVNWSSAEDIAARIEELQRDPELAKRLRARVGAAADQLSWQREEQSWLELISSIQAPEGQRVASAAMADTR